jgi:MFS family permease
VLSSLAQAGSGVGKLVLGAFSDFSVLRALVVLCAAGAGGIACIWMLPASPLVAVGGFVYGFFQAAVLVLTPMLVRECFGGGDVYPVLYARIAIAPAIGGAAANIVWPWLADNLGGFGTVFGLALAMVAVLFACSLAALRLSSRQLVPAHA